MYKYLTLAFVLGVAVLLPLLTVDARGGGGRAGAARPAGANYNRGAAGRAHTNYGENIAHPAAAGAAAVQRTPTMSRAEGYAAGVATGAAAGSASQPVYIQGSPYPYPNPPPPSPQ